MLNDSFVLLKDSFNNFPILKKDLEDFSLYALDSNLSYIKRIFRFLTLKIKGNIIKLKTLGKIKKHYNHLLLNKKISKEDYLKNYIDIKIIINDFINNACSVSQLKSWEKIFSWWHIIHIPFIYLLVFSSVIHVIAAHMY